MTKILIIEDDNDLSKELAEWLYEEKYQAVIAENELAAEQKLMEDGDNISVALVDMCVPSKEKILDDKEAGLRLIKRMNIDYPDIVSVIHTGHGDLNNAAKCMEAGAFSYFSKGGNPNLLLGVIIRAEEKAESLRFERNIRQTIQILSKEAENISDDITSALSRMEDVHSIFKRIQEDTDFTKRHLKA